MSLIYQNPTNPDEVTFALQDLVRNDLFRIRIAVAYATRAGCERLFGAIEEKLGTSALQSVSKLLVTSFDFGHTEPEALNYWRSLPNSEIRIANVQRVQGNLSLVSANANFHPKVYFFDHPKSVATLVGSANRATEKSRSDQARGLSEPCATTLNGAWAQNRSMLKSIQCGT